MYVLFLPNLLMTAYTQKPHRPMIIFVLILVYIVVVTLDHFFEIDEDYHITGGGPS